jgi:hypothetical protein
MTLTLLEKLDEARAFEATHRFEDLGDLHVPFDSLTGTEATEARLRRLAEQGGKVALVGPSGAGKSSVVSSVLGPLVEDLAEEVVPLRIPVAATDAETATDPGAFSRHLLRTVIRYSTEILSERDREILARQAANTVSTQGRQRSHRFSVGAPKLVADIGLASEVKSGAEQFVDEASAGDAIEGAARLAELFRAHGREPFLIIDDSDRWIRIGGEDLREIADAFFMRIVPLLAREVGCGFVVAVHDEYLALDSYREARQLLSRAIELPLPDDRPGAVAAVLERRMGLAGSPAPHGELLEESALAILAERYEQSRSLRKMLQTVDGATQIACSERALIIGPDLIQTALAELN